MASLTVRQGEPLSVRILANLRKFLRWLTSPQVILSIIMLAAMFYMVIIPLYRMVRITITYSEKDLRYAQDAVVGAWTAFHWIRMLTGKIGKIMMYQPMLHSMTVSLGATLLSLAIGGSLAWLVIRTDMPARKTINFLAVIPYIMPSWTIAMAWKVAFNNGTAGGVPGLIMDLTGMAPPELAGLWTHPDHHQQWAALLYLFLPVYLGSLDVDRFQPGGGRRTGRRQPFPDPAQDHFPACDPGHSFRLHHDLLEDHGYVWWPECPGCACPLLYRCDDDTLQYHGWRVWGCFCPGDRPDPVFHDHHLFESENRWDPQELRDDRRAWVHVAEDKAAQLERLSHRFR